MFPKPKRPLNLLHVHLVRRQDGKTTASPSTEQNIHLLKEPLPDSPRVFGEYLGTPRPLKLAFKLSHHTLRTKIKPTKGEAWWLLCFMDAQWTDTGQGEVMKTGPTSGTDHSSYCHRETSMDALAKWANLKARLNRTLWSWRYFLSHSFGYDFYRNWDMGSV